MWLLAFEGSPGGKQTIQTNSKRDGDQGSTPNTLLLWSWPTLGIRLSIHPAMYPSTRRVYG